MQIVARLPGDIGKTYQCANGPDGMYTIEACSCEHCDANPAAVVVKGEQDSMGYEPLFLCQACVDASENATDRYYAALDVEDRQGWFLIAEGTNYDGYGDWTELYTSYRTAVGRYRELEDRAAPYGGLYPDNGIRETTEKDGKLRVAQWQKDRLAELEYYSDGMDDDDDEL